MIRDFMISEIHILSRTPTDVKSILGIIVATIAALRLKKAHHTCSTVKDLTNLAYSFSLNRLIIRPAQVKEEISMLLELLVIVSPRAILEIGTGGGGKLFLFSRVANPNATLSFSQERIFLTTSSSWIMRIRISFS